MQKQHSPESIRPTKKAQVAVDRLKKEGKFNRTVNVFLESLVTDSPQILKVDLDDLYEKRKKMVQEFNNELARIDQDIVLTQSKLNAWIHKDADVIEGQKDLYSRFLDTVKKDPLKGTWSFQNWLDGWPEIISKAGFKCPEEAIKWCKAQAGFK